MVHSCTCYDPLFKLSVHRTSDEFKINNILHFKIFKIIDPPSSIIRLQTAAQKEIPQLPLCLLLFPPLAPFQLRNPLEFFTDQKRGIIN